MDNKNITRRKFIEKSGKVLLTTSSFMVIQSCSKKSTEPDKAICFNVSGFNVYVHNMFSSGYTHHVNVQGLASFDETVSVDSETHSLEWTDITNNYDIFAVTSFNVKIDGKDYSYPADECDSNYDDGYGE